VKGIKAALTVLYCMYAGIVCQLSAVGRIGGKGKTHFKSAWFGGLTEPWLANGWQEWRRWTKSAWRSSL